MYSFIHWIIVLFVLLCKLVSIQFNCKNSNQNASKLAFFYLKNRQIFWGGRTSAPSPDPSPVGKGTPPPHTLLLGALGTSILALTALDTRAFERSFPQSPTNKRLCYCRGTARRATSVELKYYGRFLTELLTRSSANPEKPCEYTVSWNRVKCRTNVQRIACENVSNRWMTFKVIQGHCRCHHLILFHISLPL